MSQQLTVNCSYGQDFTIQLKCLNLTFNRILRFDRLNGCPGDHGGKRGNSGEGGQERMRNPKFPTAAFSGNCADGEEGKERRGARP